MTVRPQLLVALGTLVVVVVVVVVVVAGLLSAAQPATASNSANTESSIHLVKTKEYLLPPATLDRDVGKFTIGYAYPPAVGFDSPDHNVQCYIGQGEVEIFACAVQARSWSVERAVATGRCNDLLRRIPGPRYFAVQGVLSGYDGGSSSIDVDCDKYKLVPRERSPRSTARTGPDVNKVLPYGSSIRFQDVTCTSSKSGSSSGMRCSSGFAGGSSFDVSAARLRTMRP